MKKNEKKRKGNVLVLTIILSTVLIIIGATVTTSVLSATKTNAYSKESMDIFYAAESGIQLGEAKLDKEIITNILLTGTYKLPELQYSEGSVKNVEIKFNKVNDEKIELISKATGVNGRSKLIKSYYKIESNSEPPIGGTLNILQNGLIANNVIIESPECSGRPGTHVFNMESSKVTGNSITNPECCGLSTANKVPKVEEPKFYTPNSPNSKGGYIEKVDTITINAISRNKAGNNSVYLSDYSDKNVLDRDGNSKIKGGVARIQNTTLQYKLDNFPGLYDVIVVNADKLIINPLELGAINDMRKIIICSGDIEIITSIGENISLNYSTIYGKSITIRTPSSFHQTFAPALPDKVAGMTGYNLQPDQIDEIDMVLTQYIKNWNSAIIPPGEGDGTISGEWTKLEDETIYE